MFTQEQIQSRFDYHEDGYLLWRDVPYHFAGTRVGHPSHNGYWHVYIQGRKYYIHTLIWVWHHGNWPVEIDHIRGVSDRIENLRECTHSQNMGNANWGPMRGIERHGRKYRVRISGSDWKKELGSYVTLEAAIVARNEGYREYFGEFANV